MEYIQFLYRINMEFNMSECNLLQTEITKDYVKYTGKYYPIGTILFHPYNLNLSKDITREVVLQT